MAPLAKEAEVVPPEVLAARQKLLARAGAQGVRVPAACGPLT